MSGTVRDQLPLALVADDAVALISAFRQNGSIGFHDLSLADSRGAYEVGCAANGLPFQELPHVEDLVCPIENGSIRLRHYSPFSEASGPRPVMLFVHGGGWAIGSLETHDLICRQLAFASGIDLVAVEYRLAPEHPFPVPLQDCIAALGYICIHAAEQGWDPHRVLVAGDSAGGNLATVLASDPRCAVSGTAVIGQLLFYPVASLASESPSYGRLESGFPLTADSMRWFKELYLAPIPFT
ncbi:alpha/beta hydrolase [Paeniglutamicibacter sp. MACA_103]|uniref:alpha/beta hydrolase n=1 Tax=Paeniglutamicibacter sp. MACA_103 TaxID=3377337 RepID=UPI0038946C08